jgi:hypothetical protein
VFVAFWTVGSIRGILDGGLVVVVRGGGGMPTCLPSSATARLNAVVPLLVVLRTGDRSGGRHCLCRCGWVIVGVVDLLPVVVVIAGLFPVGGSLVLLYVITLVVPIGGIVATHHLTPFTSHLTTLLFSTFACGSFGWFGSFGLFCPLSASRLPSPHLFSYYLSLRLRFAGYCVGLRFTFSLHYALRLDLVTLILYLRCGYARCRVLVRLRLRCVVRTPHLLLIFSLFCSS